MKRNVRARGSGRERAGARSFGAFAAGLALAWAASVGTARAEEGAPPPGHGAAPPQALALPPTIRAALVEEMQAVARDVQAITAAIPLAEWAAVEQAAARIRASYILERKLGPAEKVALEEALPEGFVLLDQRFHDDAERLAEAARAGRADTAVFYASRLLEGCTACHARYAAPRFPAFGPRAGAAPHGH